ncbi:uncharacterized protein LOC109718099 [Ananas comosus]|uniref:Uncharacterized protein LOC109718099 n=1 Tax=Ananas comosus TaxID=4615 RepID=A0A6P5FUR8_ANACO|nr:uncharacterized protein LOC109718099 [Ananas comosus]XP_020099709.1 uncharacterized protein LOC109718099 [Ananas comosus]
MSKKKLMLEEYAAYVRGDDPDLPPPHPLTLSQLSKISVMNGYGWIGCRKEIGEDLRRLYLMRPWRSTVEERGIAPSPDLGLKEVADDIRAIGWQECPIGSILAVRSGLPSHPKAAEDAEELKKKKKKKMRAVEQVASVEAESSTSAVAANEAMKKKKKRTMMPFPRVRGQVMPAHACG